MSLIGVRKFKDMPLSTPTQRGLAAARFKELTAIQRATIPHALCGRDVLGAAKTGSGKTLAFVIPLLENLFRQKWGRQDGLGGLVIAPTRELAMQIFKQLVDAGSYHTLSADQQTRAKKALLTSCARIARLKGRMIWQLR